MPDFRTTEVEETPYLYVERSCSMAPDDISAAMGRAFGDVWAFMQANGIAPQGPALSVYYTYDPETVTFRAGFVVDRADLDKADGAVKGDVTPAGRVVHFTHKGPYSELRTSYGKLMEYMGAEGLAMGAPTWELYVNDPDETPEDELITEIYVSLA